MGFRDLNINLEYRSLNTNVAREFYIPVLKEAIEYKRAVGFFSSSALIEVSKGISGLVSNGGTIKLIASPKLSQQDIKAIEYGYEEREKVITDALLREFKEPTNVFEEKRLNLLAYLISTNKLDIKIAYVKNENKLGIFHEKLGLLKDKDDNIIAFSGSMNETVMALKFNYESIDVFCNWKSEESSVRVSNKVAAFNKIWDDLENNVEVIDFPLLARNKLEIYNTGNMIENIDTDDYLECIDEKTYPYIPEYIELFKYQDDAIRNWRENDYCGIYDMATGTGKTYTGLASAVKLYENLNKRLAILIICPYQHLVDQWIEDIKIFNFKYIAGYSGIKDYRKNLANAIFDYNLGILDHFCFICTNKTFSLSQTQLLLEELRGNILIIADEAHNLGTSTLLKTLNKRYQFRLALSATLERHRDDEGTKALYNYFGKKCIEYPLSLAIKEGKLTPYKYYPILVSLTDEELHEYRDLTYEMQKCLMVNKKGKVCLNSKGEKIAIKRARVVAGASNKCDVLKEVIEPYKDDSHILVYCGSSRLFSGEDTIGKRQIEQVTEILGENLGMRVARFTSEEDAQTRAVLKADFKDGEGLQALIAIKCLDEGVNIPNIKTAFILASTTNPKEYIQRRGRVLRKYKGKEYAVIYDFVTIPRPLEELTDMPEYEIKKDLSLIKNELCRVKEFKDSSLNPIDSDILIDRIEDAYGLFLKFEEEGIYEYE